MYSVAFNGVPSYTFSSSLTANTNSTGSVLIEPVANNANAVASDAATTITKIPIIRIDFLIFDIIIYLFYTYILRLPARKSTGAFLHVLFD